MNNKASNENLVSRMELYPPPLEVFGEGANFR